MNRSLKLVKPDEPQISPGQLALEEIALIRKGVDRLAYLCDEVLTEKRRQLDRLETIIRAAGGVETPEQAA